MTTRRKAPARPSALVSLALVLLCPAAGATTAADACDRPEGVDLLMTAIAAPGAVDLAVLPVDVPSADAAPDPLAGPDHATTVTTAAHVVAVRPHERALRASGEPTPIPLPAPVSLGAAGLAALALAMRAAKRRTA